MLTLSLLLLTAAPDVAKATSQAPLSRPKMVLKLGEQSVTPARRATRCTCVDRSLVEPELVDHRVELYAVKRGTTQCTLQKRGQPAVIIDLTVL